MWQSALYDYDLIPEVGCFTSCLSFFPVAINKSPDKSNLRGKGFILGHGSRVESTTVVN